MSRDGRGSTNHANGRALRVSRARDRITDRELQILDLVARGLGVKEVARRLHLAEPTVRNRLYELRRAHNVSTNAELVFKLRRTIESGRRSRDICTG